MTYSFYYKNFDPADDLKTKADRLLDSIAELAPESTTPVALLEKESTAYRCAIDLYPNSSKENGTRSSMITISIREPSAYVALQRASEKVKEQISKITFQS